MIGANSVSLLKCSNQQESSDTKSFAALPLGNIMRFPRHFNTDSYALLICCAKVDPSRLWMALDGMWFTGVKRGMSGSIDV